MAVHLVGWQWWLELLELGACPATQHALWAAPKVQLGLTPRLHVFQTVNLLSAPTTLLDPPYNLHVLPQSKASSRSTKEKYKTINLPLQFINIYTFEITKLQQTRNNDDHQTPPRPTPSRLLPPVHLGAQNHPPPAGITHNIRLCVPPYAEGDQVSHCWSPAGRTEWTGD